MNKCSSIVCSWRHNASTKCGGCTFDFNESFSSNTYDVMELLTGLWRSQEFSKRRAESWFCPQKVQILRKTSEKKFSLTSCIIRQVTTPEVILTTTFYFFVYFSEYENQKDQSQNIEIKKYYFRSSLSYSYFFS